MNKNTGVTFCKNFKKPDERRDFKAHGHLDVCHFEGGSISLGRGVFEPGWRWSDDVKPIAQTASCEHEHTGYCIGGAMTIHMDDGREFEIKEGDSFHVPAGHDAWTEGASPCILLDFTGFRSYAQQGRKVA